MWGPPSWVLELLLGEVGTYALSIFTSALGSCGAIGLYRRYVIETFTCVFAEIGVYTSLLCGSITYRGLLAIYALGTGAL